MPLHTLGEARIQSEIEAVIAYLSQHDEVADPSYIHFTRQSDYLELDGKRVVQNIYPVESVNTMLSDIGQLIGADLRGEQQNLRTNQTDVYRNEGLRRTFETMRPMLRSTVLKLLPENAKTQIRKLLYVPRAQNTYDIFQSDSVKSFVREYYSRDIEVANWAKRQVDPMRNKTND